MLPVQPKRDGLLTGKLIDGHSEAVVARFQPLLRFGHFQFDPGVPLLTHGSRCLELAPKALEVLAILLKNAGHVVRKDDLLSLVWPHAFVEEGNLAVYISSLRKALAKHDGGNYIETVPKRGYRFIAPVHAVSNVRTVGASGTKALFDLAEHYLLQSTAAAARRASTVYEQCIKMDPPNAYARAGLVDSLLMRVMTGDLGAEEFAVTASRILAEAGQIDPACPAVYLSQSRLHCAWDWNWQAAAEELQHARELAVDDTSRLLTEACDGFQQARIGDLDRGLKQLQTVSAALPLNPHVWYLVAEAHYLARDFTRAAAASTDALGVHPNCWYLHAMAAKALTMLGDHNAALRQLRMARLLHPEDAGLVASIAWVHAMAGRRDHAANRLERITMASNGLRPSLSSVAMVHAALGDKHGALNKVEEACARHEWYIAGLKRECSLDSLRTDSRLQRVLSRVGL